jgi:hypothetical protein
MPDAAAVERLLDERRLIEIADAIDRAVDLKDWALTRSYFSETIRVSLPGSEPTSMPSADLVGAWEKNLYAGKASFHLRGNHLVTIDGDTAKVVSTGYAWNKVEGLEGGDLWEVWGQYEHGFERAVGGWKVTTFAFSPVHQRGNMAIPTYQPGQ